MRGNTNKLELAKKIAKRTGILRDDCSRMIDVLIESLVEDLKNGTGVHLLNFGKFEYYVRKKTQRRVPDTGEWIPVPPVTRIRFIPCRDVKYGVAARDWEQYITEDQEDKDWYKSALADREAENNQSN